MSTDRMGPTSEGTEAPSANKVLTVLVAPFVLAWLAIRSLPDLFGRGLRALLRPVVRLLELVGRGVATLVRLVMRPLDLVARAILWIIRQLAAIRDLVAMAFARLLEPIRALLARFGEWLAYGLTSFVRMLRIWIRMLRELLGVPWRALRRAVGFVFDLIRPALRLSLAVGRGILDRAVLALHIAWAVIWWLPRQAWRAVAHVFRSVIFAAVSAIAYVLQALGRAATAALQLVRWMTRPVVRLVRAMVAAVRAVLARVAEMLGVSLRALGRLVRAFVRALGGAIVAAWLAIRAIVRPFSRALRALSRALRATWSATTGAVRRAWGITVEPLVSAVMRSARTAYAAIRPSFVAVRRAFSNARAGIRQVVDDQRRAWRAVRARFGGQRR